MKRVAAVIALVVAASGALAQTPPSQPATMSTPPGAFKPDADPGRAETGDDTATDTWIFSGVLNDSRETFSGTLVTGKAGAQFELKLANGATCDGSELTAGTGLVRLSDVTCSDDRVMRALFVPQGGEELKVFGHVGEERFATVAHLLGTKPIAEKPQTTAPQAPPTQAPPTQAPPTQAPLPRSSPRPDPG